MCFALKGTLHWARMQWCSVDAVSCRRAAARQEHGYMRNHPVSERIGRATTPARSLSCSLTTPVISATEDIATCCARGAFQRESASGSTPKAGAFTPKGNTGQASQRQTHRRSSSRLWEHSQEEQVHDPATLRAPWSAGRTGPSLRCHATVGVMQASHHSARSRRAARTATMSGRINQMSESTSSATCPAPVQVYWVPGAWLAPP